MFTPPRLAREPVFCRQPSLCVSLSTLRGSRRLAKMAQLSQEASRPQPPLPARECPPPPLAPMEMAAHSAAPSRPAPSLGAEGDSAASATPARDELGLPPMSPAARPPTHALPPVSAAGSQSARAVDHPSTPKRRSTRTMTPSSRGLEFIADRAGSASPAKTRRPPDSEPESCSDADTAGAKRKRARIKQHTTTTTTSPSK